MFQYHQFKIGPVSSVGLSVGNITVKWGFILPVMLDTKEVNNGTGLDSESQL